MQLKLKVATQKWSTCGKSIASVVLGNQMSSTVEKERDVRNFRSWYYDNLGLRGVEQRKALDLLLKDDEIDVEKLSTFCIQFGLPAFRRPMVWKLLLGVLPKNQQIHEFVIKQQAEQVEDLLRTLKAIRQLSVKNDSIPSQIIKMHLLNEGEMGFMQPSNDLEKKLKVLMSIAKLMCEIFQDLVDCFWMTTRFFKLQETYAIQLKTLPELVEQWLSVEDNELWKYLTRMGVIQQLPTQKWFESFFAEDLSDPSLERVWDKIVAGSCAILVFVAVAILVVFRQTIISKKTPDLILRFLTQIPQDSCKAIVGKAMDLHIKYGTNISTPPTTAKNTTPGSTGGGRELGKGGAP